MKMSRPKNGQYSGVLFTHIQTTLIDTISHPTFTVQFPPLDPGSWNRLLTPHSAENERLEFVGDSIIDSVLSDQLYSQLPAGTPGQYTVVRSALHSNQTFGHLAMKLDTSGPAKQDILQIGRFRSKHRVKQAADLFETIAAAVYLQSGYWTLFDWVSSVFHQLIPIAIGAHTNFVTTFPMVRKSRVLRPKALSNRLPGKIEKKQIHQRTSPTHDTLHFPPPYQSVANSHFDMNLSTPQTLVSVPYMYQAGPHLRVDAWFPATGIPSYPVLPILTIRHTTPEHSPIGKTMAANSPCSHTTENPHLDVAKSLPLPQEPGGAEVSVAEPCSGAHGKFDQPRRWFQALCRQFSSS